MGYYYLYHQYLFMKRLTRLQGTEIIPELNKLLNKEADFILSSGSVIHGRLFKISNDFLIVKNGILNKIKIDLSDLTELVIDKESTDA